jgi:hypothetical protein
MTRSEIMEKIAHRHLFSTLDRNEFQASETFFSPSAIV